MLASLTSDLAALGVVLAIIAGAWLFLKREGEDSPLVKFDVSLDHIGKLAFPITIGLAGLSADRFWGGVEVAGLVVAALLSLLLVVMVTARHYPESGVGKAFNWVIGRKPDLLSRPSYVVAETLRSQGRLEEAMVEIDQQLAKAPHDFVGLMLSAELAAMQWDNLPLAERAIEDIVKGPKRSQAELVFALNRLAEWRLAKGSVPDTAAEPLYRLARMFPNSQEARNARVRAEEIKAAALAQRP